MKKMRFLPLMHWFSMNFLAPTLMQFEVFLLFSVEWFLCHLTMSIRRIPGYLFIGKRIVSRKAISFEFKKNFVHFNGNCHYLSLEKNEKWEHFKQRFSSRIKTCCVVTSIEANSWTKKKRVRYWCCYKFLMKCILFIFRIELKNNMSLYLVRKWSKFEPNVD